MPDITPDPLADRHSDRARAESFGAVAELYDRLRPPYATALLGLGGSVRSQCDTHLWLARRG